MKQKIVFLALIVFSGYKSQAGIAIGGPLYLQQTFSEEQKITQLINYVEKLDAKFIRNGAEFTPYEAAEHLRLKRAKAGIRIKTAKEFIDNVASKSNVSGDPYLIKYPNGTKLMTRDVLYNELKKIEVKHSGNSPGFRAIKFPVC